jgi:4'-phosphopantetheinyl transferase
MATVHELPPGGCDVWWAETQTLPERHLRVLDEVETERAARFRPLANAARGERDRFTVGAAVIRLALARYLGCAPADVPVRRTCPHCGGPHGRPLAIGTDLEISVSHSAERVLVAFSRAGRVGVDIERIRPGLKTESLYRLVLSVPEQEQLVSADPAAALRGFFVYWTRKEALLKAAGCGLRKPMTELVVSPPDAPPRLLSWTGEPAVPAEPALVDLDGGADWAGALALLDSTGPVRHLDGRELLG